MTDDDRRAEIEAVELATALKQHFAPNDVGYCRIPVTAHAIDLARWFLDRVRDARGDDVARWLRSEEAEWVRIEAIRADVPPEDALADAWERRSPQGEDHEPKMPPDKSSTPETIRKHRPEQPPPDALGGQPPAEP